MKDVHDLAAAPPCIEGGKAVRGSVGRIAGKCLPHHRDRDFESSTPDSTCWLAVLREGNLTGHH